MRYQFVEKAIRHILVRSQADAQGACPEANELAAYLEGRLISGEAARFEEHASNCAACQEKLALSLQLAEENTGTAGNRAVEPQRFAYRSSPIRFALGAAVVLIVGVLLFQATRESRRLQPTPQIAHLEPRGSVSGGAEAKLASPERSGTSPAVSARAATSQSPSATRAPARSQAESQPSRPAGNPATVAVPPDNLALNVANVEHPQAPARSGATKQVVAAEPVEEVPKSVQAQPDAEALKLKIAAGRAAIANFPPQARTETVAAQAGAESVQKQIDSIQSVSLEQKAFAEVRVVVARQAGAGKVGGTTADAAKKVGDRVFYKTASYWVDVECVSHSEAPSREITRDSKEYAAILAKEPALAELHSAGIPILLYWNGTNYLIR
jgi:hypothetical protein